MHTAQVDISLFSQIIDLSSVFLAALLGGVLARADKLDPVGFIFIAIASGLGGGIVRDTLIQKGTPSHSLIPSTSCWRLWGAFVAYVLPIRGKLWDRVYPWLDALLLGLWAAASADRALAYGMDWMPATLLGLITGIGGSSVTSSCSACWRCFEAALCTPRLPCLSPGCSCCSSGSGCRTSPSPRVSWSAPA